MGDTAQHGLADPLHGVSLFALVGGVVLYLLGHVAFKLRALRVINMPRAGMAVALLALLAAGAPLPALVLLAILTAAVVALMVFETWHLGEERVASGTPPTDRMSAMQLTGKTVLLTGATGGIGHAIGRRVHRAGATLILTGRRAEVLEPLAKELGARTLVVDLADPAALDSLLDDAGEVDIVVANAALPASGLLSSFSTDGIDAAIDVNLRAPIVMARHYADAFAAQGSGHLVFISSISGKVGTPHSSMYSATKFGLRGFAQALRVELAAESVGVSVVFPGFVRGAGMFADSGAVLPKGIGTSSPEQVADAVVDAIERNRGEVDVAPLTIRASAMVAGLVPELAAKITKLVGGHKIGSDLAAGQAKHH